MLREFSNLNALLAIVVSLVYSEYLNLLGMNNKYCGNFEIAICYSLFFPHFSHLIFPGLKLFLIAFSRFVFSSGTISRLKFKTFLVIIVSCLQNEHREKFTVPVLNKSFIKDLDVVGLSASYIFVKNWVILVWKLWILSSLTIRSFLKSEIRSVGSHDRLFVNSRYLNSLRNS